MDAVELNPQVKQTITKLLKEESIQKALQIGYRYDLVSNAE